MSEKPETRIMRNQVVMMQALLAVMNVDDPSQYQTARSRLVHNIRRTEENILETSGEYPRAETMHKRESD